MASRLLICYGSRVSHDFRCGVVAGGTNLGKVFRGLVPSFRFNSTINMPTALLLLSEGAEEMETVITADVLRRGGVSLAQQTRWFKALGAKVKVVIHD